MLRGVVLWDAQKRPIHNQPLFVVREATKSEWQADLIANGGPFDELSDKERPFFYEVTTD